MDSKEKFDPTLLIGVHTGAITQAPLGSQFKQPAALQLFVNSLNLNLGG